MIGTIESVTKLGGSEVGNAIKAILINLQNVTSDKIVDTLDAANASMTEFVNGTEKLRNPIDILRDFGQGNEKIKSILIEKYNLTAEDADRHLSPVIDTEL